MKEIEAEINGLQIRNGHPSNAEELGDGPYIELGLYGGWEFYSFEEVRQIRDVLSDWLASSGTVGK